MTASDQDKFDEMHMPDGSVREAYQGYNEWLEQQDQGWMRRKAFEAELVGRIEDASARLLREAQQPGSSSIDTVTQAVTEK